MGCTITVFTVPELEHHFRISEAKYVVTMKLFTQPWKRAGQMRSNSITGPAVLGARIASIIGRYDTCALQTAAASIRRQGA